MKIITTLATCISIVCMTTCIVTSSSAEEVIASTELPPSIEPARVPDPPCGTPNANTTAAEVLNKLGTEADKQIGFPLVGNAASGNPDFTNWAAVRLGVHKGPSSCQTICVTTPANRPVEYKSCYRALDNQGNDAGIWCNPNPVSEVNELIVVHNWGRTTNPSVTIKGNNRTTCLMGKNHSHVTPRLFQLRAIY